MWFHNSQTNQTINQFLHSLIVAKLKDVGTFPEKTKLNGMLKKNILHHEININIFMFPEAGNYDEIYIDKKLFNVKAKV